MQRRLLRLAILLAVAVAAHFAFRSAEAAKTSSAPLERPRADATPAAESEAQHLGPCEVTHVTDGDTLNVRCDGRKERVRMLQIDTPERDDPLYAEAGDALGALIAGRSVELELGPERRDDYGRLLAYVFVGGENLNLAMIERGWSPYFDRYGAGAYPREFARAEREARDAKLGIWGLAH